MKKFLSVLLTSLLAANNLAYAGSFSDVVTATDRFQTPSTTAASSTCMADDTDRLFGDKNCNGVKDVGEEYLDQSGGGTPGGSDTQVQFNDGGSSFGGDAGLTYNKTDDALDINKQLAVGSTASNASGKVVTLSETSTAVADFTGISSVFTIQPSASNSANDVIGISSELFSTALETNHPGSLYGAYFAAQHNASVNIAFLNGNYVVAENNSPNSVSTVRAGEFHASTEAVGGAGNIDGIYVAGATDGSGNATNIRSLIVDGDHGSSGTLTNAYLIYLTSFVKGFSSGALDNIYGLFISAQSGATNNWNLFSDGASARNKIVGDLTVGATDGLGKLAVDGDSDEIQLLVQGNGTQTNPIATFETSAGDDVFAVTTSHTRVGTPGRFMTTTVTNNTGSVSFNLAGTGTDPAWNYRSGKTVEKVVYGDNTLATSVQIIANLVNIGLYSMPYIGMAWGAIMLHSEFIQLGVGPGIQMEVVSSGLWRIGGIGGSNNNGFLWDFESGVAELVMSSSSGWFATIDKFTLTAIALGLGNFTNSARDALSGYHLGQTIYNSTKETVETYTGPFGHWYQQRPNPLWGGECFDDFMAAGTVALTTAATFFGACMWVGSITNSGTATVGTGVVGEQYGIALLSTGSASASGSANINRSSGRWTFGTAFFHYKTMVRVTTLSDATNTFIIYAGMHDGISSTEPVDGVYFKYNHAVNSGQWTFKASAASSRNTDASGASGVTVVAGTDYELEAIVNDSGSSVNYYINGAFVGTLSANIPTGANAFGPVVGIYKTNGTAARTLEVDYWWEYYDFASARG